jgi:DNA-binding NarL/FixJ family response regulator
MSTSTTPTPRTRVLLVDDHDLIRKGLRHAFERDRQFEVIGEAATAADAVRQAGNLQPDVVIMAYGGTLPHWKTAVDVYRIPVVMLPNSSLEGLKTTVRLTGEILGARESQAAAEYIRYFDDNIRRVARVTSKMAQSERPKVLHTATPGILVVDGRESVIDDWITVAGAASTARFPAWPGSACE